MHTIQLWRTIVLPLGGLVGKIQLLLSFLCSGETTKIETTQANKKRSLSAAPMSIYFGCSTFQKTLSSVAAQLNTAVWLQVSNLLFILRSLSQANFNHLA